jgi:hypothetical protein
MVFVTVTLISVLWSGSQSRMHVHATILLMPQVLLNLGQRSWMAFGIQKWMAFGIQVVFLLLVLDFFKGHAGRWLTWNTNTSHMPYTNYWSWGSETEACLAVALSTTGFQFLDVFDSTYNMWTQWTLNVPCGPCICDRNWSLPLMRKHMTNSCL